MTHRRDVLKAGLAGAASLSAGETAAAAPAPFVLAPPATVTVPVAGGGRFPVRRIYCVGRNYLAHRRELGNSETDPLFFFAKHRDTIVQPGGRCAYPSLTHDYQHEVELVVAMKSAAWTFPPNAHSITSTVMRSGST